MWKCLCAILLYITFHSFIHSSVRLSSVSLKQQNSTAHLVLRVPKTDRISHPASLHWLPIYLWIQYKHASLCYCCLNLTELQTVYKPTHQSSSNTSILYLPFVCCTVCLEQSPLPDWIIKHTTSGYPVDSLSLSMCVRACGHACRSLLWQCFVLCLKWAMCWSLEK